MSDYYSSEYEEEDIMEFKITNKLCEHVKLEPKHIPKQTIKHVEHIFEKEFIISDKPIDGYTIINIKKYLTIKNIVFKQHDKRFVIPTFNLFWLGLYKYTDDGLELDNRTFNIWNRKCRYNSKLNPIGHRLCGHDNINIKPHILKGYIDNYEKTLTSRFNKELLILRYAIKSSNKILFISNKLKTSVKFNIKTLKEYVDKALITFNTYRKPVLNDFIVINKLI